MKKQILSLTLAGAMMLSVAAPALAAEGKGFADVAEDAWYAPAVAYAAEKGLMAGTGADKFSPDGTVTRGTVFQTLYNLAGKPEAGETSFVDVEGKWYAAAAAWAEAQGLAAVPADKTFAGDRAITRMEIAAILARYAETAHLPAGADHGKTESAPDYAAIPEWAMEGMEWCVNTGVLSGDSKGSLNPAGTARRAELAQMLKQFTGMEIVSMADYLKEHEDQFFLTGKTEYTIQGKIVSAETHIHNELEDVDYTVTDDGVSVILKGTVGEEWVTKLEKVLKTYTKADGSALTAEDFTDSKDTYIDLKTKANPDANFACYVPAGTAVQVDTAWGDVLYANRTGVPHGSGDYLVCNNKDGEPDFSDVWVVNGAVFDSTYDMSRAPRMGAVKEIEKYGHAVLDITIEDFEKAGFELGDTVNVTFDNGYELKGIPFFDGYYVAKGEPMLRAYPGHTNIAVCINYGKLNVVANVAPGSVAAVSMAVKGGEKAAQELNSLVYTDERGDYASDEIFANFRVVSVGDLGEGALVRSASPVSNEHGRAAYADALIEKAGVAAVLNLADTDEEIQGYIAGEGFASGYYKSLYEDGKVIALGMPVDYSSDSFGDTLAGGLARLSELKGPYLVHCTEGKDRAGFTSALLECLMGASLEEVVADYMVSYENYYGVTKAGDGEKYDLIVNNNIMGMLRAIAGVDKSADLGQVDLQKAAESYLTAHGMTAEQVTALKANLSAPAAE